MENLKTSVDAILLNPDYEPFLAILKAARNGAVYGAKVRFPHALVMVFLFRSGTVRDKARLILKATRQHARNLAMYASLYKLVLYALRTLRPAGRNKELRYDTFVAGLVGGYVVFGRGYQSSVNQQISIYVFARVVLALAKMMVMGRGRREAGTGAAAATAGGGGERSWAAGRTEARTRGLLAQNAWPVFASLSWAFVMYIFRWYPEMLQPSLRSSMKYIYTNADYWTGFRNFLLYNQ